MTRTNTVEQETAQIKKALLEVLQGKIISTAELRKRIERKNNL